MRLKVLWNIILSESLESHCYRKAVLPEITSADDKKNRIVSWEFCEIVSYCLWLLCKCFLRWWHLFTANCLCAFEIILTSLTAYQSKSIAWLRVKVHLSVPLLSVATCKWQRPSCLSYEISKDKPFSQQHTKILNVIPNFFGYYM